MNKNGGKKLLALAMVLSMVLCAGFIVLETGDSDAAAPTNLSSVSLEAIPEGGVITTTVAKYYLVTENTSVEMNGATDVDVKFYVVDGKIITINGNDGNRIDAIIYSASSTAAIGASQAANIGTYYSDLSVTVDDSEIGQIVVKSDNENSKLYISGTSDVVPSVTDGVEVESGKTLVSQNSVANLTFGLAVIKADSSVKYYATGATAPGITISSDESVKVVNGTVEVSQGGNIVSVYASAAADVTVTYGEKVPTITYTSGSPVIKVKSGMAISSTMSAVTGMTDVVEYSKSSSHYVYSAQIKPIADVKTVANDVDTVTIIGKVIQNQSVSGDAQTITMNGAELTIPEGIEVGENITLTATSGKLYVYGTVLGTVNSTASELMIGPVGYADGTASNIISGKDSVVSGYLSGEIEDALLGTGDNEIEVGKTYKILGDFGLNGNDLTVNGTLIIVSGANVFGVGTETITLGPNAKLVVEGTLASKLPVIIEDKNNKSITIEGIEGAVFGYKADPSDPTTSVISISGDITPADGAIVSEVTLGADAFIFGDLTISKNVALILDVAGNTALKDSVITVNGTISGNLSADGAVDIVINGELVKGSTITVLSGSSTSTVTTDVDFSVVASETPDGGSQINYGNVSGIAISVEKTVKVEGDTTTTTFTPYVSGTVSFIDTDGEGVIASSKVTVTGNYSVVGELTIGNYVLFSTTGTVTIDGTVIDKMNVNPVGTYVGAKYEITVNTTSGPVKTAYYTTLGTALNNIDFADKKTVTTNVTNITEGFELEDGQKLIISSSASITSDAVVIAKSGSTITGGISNVSGKLTVQSGAKVPVPAAYDAKYTAGTDIIYAGVAIAIKESDGSKPIDVTTSNVEGDLVIEAGKTLNVINQISIEGDLVIEEGASIIGGTIVVNGESNDVAAVVVNGVVDLSDGNIVLNNAEITVSGKIIAQNLISYINSAYYQDDSNDYIYTDIASAVESGKDVTVVGEYSESGIITLAEKQKITINESADVTIGEIILSAGASVTSAGKLVAVITTSEVSIEIDGKVTIISVAATEEDAAYTSITALNGALDVFEGTVSIDETVSLVKGSVAIETGAELIVSKNKTLTVDADTVVTIDGKLTVNGTLNATEKDIEVSGDLVINNNSTVKSLEIIGIVEVADKQKLTVSENVIVGSYENTGANGTIIGNVYVDGTNTIKAYAGSDLENAVLPTEKTTFFVNGAEFFTVYTNGAVAVEDAVTQEDLAQIPGVVVPSTEDIKWVKENGTSITPSAVNVGGCPVLKTTLSTEKVTASVYVQAGIELHLGYGFYYSAGSATLSIGPNDAYGVSDDGKSVVVKVFVNGIEIPVVDNKVEITADMIGQDVVVQASYGSAPGPTPAPVDPSKDYIVSTSVVDDKKVIVSVISLDGGYLVAGTEVEVTFTTLVETVAFGQTVYKPTPVTETITIGDDKPTLENSTYELADILGDKYAVINVISKIGTAGFGNTSLNYKG